MTGSSLCLQQANQLPRVLDRIAVAIVIEVRPDALRARVSDPLRPHRQFLARVIVPVPALRAVEANVHVAGRLHEFIRKARAAARAEDRAQLSKRAVDVIAPPASMAKLDDVSPLGIERFEHVLQGRARVTKAGRKLKQKAPEARAQDVGDKTKIAYEHLHAAHSLAVRDQLIHFHAVHEAPAPSLSDPRLNRSQRGPAIEGRVQLDRAKLARVMVEP